MITLATVKQQVKNMAKLALYISLPYFLLYLIFPELFATFLGKGIVSLCIGICISYLNYAIAKQQASSFLFIPSLQHKENFDRCIATCKLKPEEINLRYGYSNDQVALTILNTIILDPLLFSSFEQDPVAVQTKKILDEHIVPTLSAQTRERLTKIREVFSAPAQNFIFKHELAHVYYTYGYKKILVLAIIVTIVVYSGISVALLCAPIIGLASILVGIAAAAAIDLPITYLSNATFKLYEEKKADLFAAQYSTPEEIEAAADFFEQVDLIKTATKEPTELAIPLPSIFLGYLDGTARAKYLRELGQTIAKK